MIFHTSRSAPVCPATSPRTPRPGRGGDVNAHNSCSPQRAAAATPRGDQQPAANSAAPQPASANGGGHQVSRLRKTATNYNLLPRPGPGLAGVRALHVESRSCGAVTRNTVFYTDNTDSLHCTAHPPLVTSSNKSPYWN